MSNKSFIVFLFSMFCVLNLNAQEICNNGIDDDGDGIIDIADPDCICGEIIPDIVEGDFEDFNCCPQNITVGPGTGMYCLNDGWALANEATADYFNTCGWVGGGGIPLAPMPFPSGDGVAGMISSPTWNENVGVCMPYAMIPGETYDISFFVGFSESGSYMCNLDVEMSLYGANDCAEFPSSVTTCMSGDAAWFEMETFNITGVAQETWAYYSASFTPTQPAQAIAIGHSCDFADANPSDYHFIDNIIIDGVFSEVLDNFEVTVTGDCVNGVFIEALDGSAVLYQWYYNGDMIPGGNTNPYQVPVNANGEYQVYMEFGDGTCAVSVLEDVNTDLYVLDIPGEVNSIACPGDENGSIMIMNDSPNLPLVILWDNGETTNFIDQLAPGNYTVTVTDANGCFGIETFSIDTPPDLAVSVYVEQPTQDTPLGYAALTITGGTPPYDISWSNGNDGLSDDTLLPGVYNVLVTDANGCEVTIEFEIFDPLEVVVVSVSESCLDECNGAITITEINGGVPPYDIDWNVSGTGNMIDGLCEGAYSFMIEDAIGTVLWVDIDLDPGTDMELIFDYQSVLCDEEGTTTIDLTVIGGTEPLSYEWQDGSTEEDYLVAEVGFYAVTVSDASGCVIIDDFYIDFSFPIEVESVIAEAPCGSTGQGAVDITVGGGTEPYNYNWSNGFDTQDIDNLFSGIYSVTISDVNGCYFEGSYEVTSNADMEVTPSVTQIICSTDENGGISLSVVGGTAPIDIIWSTGDTDDVLTDLIEGDYGVTVTDALNCIWINNFEIEAQSQVSLEETIIPVACFGESTGSINLFVTSSGIINNYAWSNGMDTEDIPNLTAGEYSLTMTDDFSCNYEFTFLIEENLEFDIQESIINIDCFGDEEGAISIATDGMGAYEFEWNGGSEGDNIIDQMAGIYTLTITNDQDCDQEYEFTITEPENLLLNPSIIHAGCSQGGSGSIKIEPTGGVAPYIINWDFGSNLEEIQNLSAGPYALTLTDANGCVVEESFVINDAVPISIQESITDVTCFDGADGSISVSVMGGTAPFDYLWNTGETTEMINLLPIGSYSVVVTDDNDCTEELFFMVEEPANVEIIESIVDSRCFGEQGSISLEISGGVGPYDINWDTGGSTNQITGLAGSYNVEVVDANNCLYTFNYSISEPGLLGATVLSSSYPSQLGDDGAAELSITGGTMPFDVQWSNGSFGISVNDLSYGIHTATIIDANGCETTVELSFIPDDISFEFAIVENLCFGDCVASIALDITGGQEPYNILWSHGANSVDATNLCAGTYAATITDALGTVIETADFIITTPDELLTSSLITEVSCVGTDDGEILLTASGGTSPYSYLWNTNATINSIENLSPGIYDVTISDANQCRIIESYEIKELNALDLSLTPVIAPCDSEFGSIQVDGPDVSNTEFIVDGQNVGLLIDGIIENVAVGQHDVSYVINGNCELSLGQVSVIKPEEVDLTVSPISVEVKLDEIVTIELDLVSQNPISNYTIDWQSVNTVVCNDYDDASACVSIELIALESELLTIEFIDENGCIETVIVNIRVIDPPVIVLPNIFSPNGDGDNESFVFYTSRKVEEVNAFVIYDRWGSVMHEQKNEEAELMQWNGRASGKEVSAGVYIYLIELQMIDGSTERFTGDLTLIK